jgi:hypothetical protein
MNNPVEDFPPATSGTVSLGGELDREALEVRQSREGEKARHERQAQSM